MREHVHGIGQDLVAAILVGVLTMLGMAGSAAEGFHPGEVWRDMDGNPINAHAGGILFDHDRYYWYGQHMTALPAGSRFPPSAGNLTEVGVTCYSSADLSSWRYEGVCLTVSDDPANDLYKGLRIERPKVLRCPSTGQYVMWFHYVRSGKTHGQSYEAAVCVSERVTGPFRLVKTLRPNGGQMVRDCTLFGDDDGKAYFFYTSEGNRTMHVTQLTDDYLDAGTRWERILDGKFREAPAVFRHGGRCYLITSACSGWAHNAASYATADQPLGPWTTVGHPCVGPDAGKTFESQGTFVVPVQGRSDAFIFMADRWNPKDMADSRYVWLPIAFGADAAITLRWAKDWDLSVFNH
jgi:hypothetical protein